MTHIIIVTVLVAVAGLFPAIKVKQDKHATYIRFVIALWFLTCLEKIPPETGWVFAIIVAAVFLGLEWVSRTYMFPARK